MRQPYPKHSPQSQLLRPSSLQLLPPFHATNRMKTDRKPPLARSPMRLRGRRTLRPTNTNTITPLRTPTAKITKTQMKDSEIRPEYQTMSCDLRALSKMVQDELGAMNAKNYSLSGTNNLGSAFERGRFYDEYIARRNERLRKKQSGIGLDEPKTVYNLGVKVESTKKKDYKKKAESFKKSVAATYSVDRSEHPRYALRSTTKKPPLPVPMNVEEKTTVRRTPPATRSRRK